MIESKEALVGRFLRLAEQFEASQNPVTGIELDDAMVALKRYILSVENNQDAASLLNRLGKLLRSRDMGEFSSTLAAVRNILQ